jgi:hypothetical protein
MIDLALARERLVEVITAGVATDESVTIYPSPPNSQIALPAIWVGQPSTQFGTFNTGCERYDTTTVPILVVVRWPGTNDQHQVAQLDDLWPQAAAAVADALGADQTLSGLCKAGSITQALFGLISAQGQDCPAQTISVELYG